MRKFAHIAILLLAATACEFRPLQDPSNVSYVRVYLDETDLLNVKEGFYNPAFLHPEYKRPEILRIGLFDAKTGDLATERYLRNQGDDERGHFYDGYVIVNPGTYSLRAYNFGTESTLVGNEYNWKTMFAYTNEISQALSTRYQNVNARATDGSESAEERALEHQSIRYDADILFVADASSLTVPGHYGVDTLRNAAGEPWFTASSVVDHYYLQIGVIGSQYISSSVALLSGMASELPLATRDLYSADPATLYFDLYSGAYPDGYYPGVTDYHCIYGTFGTFGRWDTENNYLQVAFEFVTTYGQNYEVTIDIAPEFLKENAVKHRWLLIDKMITIPDPPDTGGGGGGLAPSVVDWGDVHSEIYI